MAYDSDNPRGGRRVGRLRKPRRGGGGGGSDELIARGPGGTRSSESRDIGRDTPNLPGPRAPIGVPEDYRVPRVVTERPATTADALARASEAGYGVGAVVSGGARYFEGDQYRPASTSPQTISEIQRAMVDAGLLSTGFRPGLWDAKTADAYAEVLAYANASGLSDAQALQAMVENPPIAEPGERLVFRTTNKEDLKALFRTVSADKLGVAFNSAQLDELADAYNWRELQIQNDFAHDPNANVEPTVESPETFLHNEMMRRDPTGYHAGQVVNEGIPMFLEALKGWAG